MADALASGASVRKDVGVQVPPRARISKTEKRQNMLPEDIKVRNFNREKFSLTARVNDFRQFFTWATNGFGAADWNKVVPGAMTLLVVLALIGCWRLKPPIEVVVFAIGILGMSFFSSTLGFRPRFVMTAFPLFIGLNAILRTSVQRQIAVSLSVASLSLYSMIVLQLLYQTP